MNYQQKKDALVRTSKLRNTSSEFYDFKKGFWNFQLQLSTKQ